MTVRVFQIACLILAMSGCGGDKALSPLSKDAVILAFGDSLTFGTGATPSTSYPAVLAQKTGLQVINAGVPGEVSAAGLQRLPRLLQQHQPDLLVLIHGGNDLLRRQSRTKAASNLEAMIAMARSKGVQVVMVGVPKPGLILSVAEFYEQVADKTDTPIEPDAIADILQYPSNKADAVHPNAAGYRMLAEAVYDLLVDQGAIAN